MLTIRARVLLALRYGNPHPLSGGSKNIDLLQMRVPKPSYWLILATVYSFWDKQSSALSRGMLAPDPANEVLLLSGAVRAVLVKDCKLPHPSEWSSGQSVNYVQPVGD